MDYDVIFVIDCSFDRDGIRMRQIVNVEDVHGISMQVKTCFEFRDI